MVRIKRLVIPRFVGPGSPTHTYSHSHTTLRSGSGYLGRQVCKEALTRGWSVTSLSRRGKNPLPGTSLDKVNWVKGSGTDADLLRSLVGESDAVVHSIGLLLDESSGLKNLNFITSGNFEVRPPPYRSARGRRGSSSL